MVWKHATYVLNLLPMPDLERNEDNTTKRRGCFENAIRMLSTI